MLPRCFPDASQMLPRWLPMLPQMSRFLLNVPPSPPGCRHGHLQGFALIKKKKKKKGNKKRKRKTKRKTKKEKKNKEKQILKKEKKIIKKNKNKNKNKKE